MLVGKIVDDDVGCSVGVYGDREEVSECAVSSRDGAAKSLGAELAIVCGMFAGLDLIDRGSTGCCAVYLNEIREPFRTCGCLAAVEPRGERVRVSPSTCPVEDDVNGARSSGYSPRHYVRVRGIPVHLKRR